MNGTTRQFLRGNARLLTFGFIFSLFSSFGQTFLISLYVPHLQKTFDMSDGFFSSLYGVATLGSAFTITWLGRYIDKLRLTKFSIRVLIGLAVTLVLFSQVYHVAMLFIAIYGIRLFGQGMMTHTSVTSMGRFFDKNRGKAISMAGLGHSFGEATFPIIIVTAIAAVGWRYTLLGSAVVVLALMPLTLFLLLNKRRFSDLKQYFPAVGITAEEQRESRTLRLLSNRILWIIAPPGIASGCFGTGFLFFQLKLGEANGWSVAFIAAAFSAYAVGNALATLAGGWLADTFTGRKLFPLMLAPFMVGLLALMLSDKWWVYILLIVGIAITAGFGSAVKNTAIAELFGVRMLGSVRSLFTTIMVFSTALGPLIFGVLLDQGYSFEFIALLAFITFVLVTLNALRVLRLQPKEVVAAKVP